MQRHIKLFVSAPPTVSGCFQGWDDLPECLLHSILLLLGSFRDFLAFAATCPSWRAAFLAYPSKSTLLTLVPPLLIQPNISVDAPHLPSNNGHCKLHRFKVIDPANRSAKLSCQIGEEISKMHFIGSSYGHLFCYHPGYCLIVDPFSGAKVSPPRIPFRNDSEKLLSSMNPLRDQICFSILTAPLASPNSHLLFSTRSSLFDWSVGSHSWSELPYSGARIVQIVQFNGQFIAMDFNDRIYTLELAPQLRLQEITTNLFQGLPVASWLVVCSDMLLRVGHVCDHIPDRMGLTVAHTVHHLDMSSKPAKWVNVEKLDNWAVFAGGDMRNMLLPCMNPERWGERSSCLYHARNSPPWIVHGLAGAPGQRNNRTIPYGIRRRHVHFFWVYPSMLYSDGRGPSRATATTA